MQQQTITDTPTLPAVPVVTAPHLDCAWCLGEQRIAAGEGSHGICRRHEAIMLVQYRKLCSRRLANRGATV